MTFRGATTNTSQPPPTSAPLQPPDTKTCPFMPKITLRQELIIHSGMSRLGAQVLTDWVLRCWLIGHPSMAQWGAQA